MKRWLLLFFLLIGGSAAPAAAQVTQADTAAVLLSVANRLRAEGRTQLADELLALILERYRGTPAATEAQRMRGTEVRAYDERSGRTEALVWSTTYGLLVGATLPIALGADDPEAIGIGLIVGGPTGYLLGRQIVKRRALSEGQARAMSFGTIWGAWQGFGWTQALDIGQEEFCDEFDVCYEEDPDGETLLRASLIGSVAGFTTGYFLSRKSIPTGTATTVNFGALWGTWFGAATSILIDDEDGDNTLTYALIGGDVGLIATALAAPKWQLSQGRARLISISGVAGLLAGLGIVLIAEADDNSAILIPMAGSAVGLGLGVAWTRNYDERVRPDNDGGLDGALLEWDRGTIRPGLPTLQLRSIETRRFQRPARQPALHVPLFKATF